MQENRADGAVLSNRHRYQMVRGQIYAAQPNVMAKKHNTTRCNVRVVFSYEKFQERMSRKHRRIIVRRYIPNSPKEGRLRDERLNDESPIKRLREEGQKRETSFAIAVLCCLRGYNSIKISVKRCASYNHPVFSGSSAVCAVVIPERMRRGTYKFNGSNHFAGSRLAAAEGNF